MDRKRCWRTIRLLMILNGKKRMDYIRKNHIFADFGENSFISSRLVPLYPKLISIGNNVYLAAKVSLVPHDMIHTMLNNMMRERKTQFMENIGCIRIEDNVFIGMNTTILSDVHIGKNVIIGAGSLVNKDLAGGYIYAGVPARRIDTFENFIRKRRGMPKYPENFCRNGDSIDNEFADWLWKNFWRRKISVRES